MADVEQPKYEPGRPIARLQLIKTIPRIGSYPELQTYHCDRCRNVETIEVEWEGFQPRRLS